jgi:hypothetical protein
MCFPGFKVCFPTDSTCAATPRRRQVDARGAPSAGEAALHATHQEREGPHRGAGRPVGLSLPGGQIGHADHPRLLSTGVLTAKERVKSANPNGRTDGDDDTCPSEDQGELNSVDP